MAHGAHGWRPASQAAESASQGDIVLLFGDESEALAHPYLAHAWARKGADLRIPAPGQAAKVAMLGVLDWTPRELVVRTSQTKRSTDFIAVLEELDRRYGPKPGVAIKPTVLTLDNGPIHTSKATRAALAERAHWLTVEWLQKYAPELNDIEEVWRDLKRHYLAHQTFTGADDLDHAIHNAVGMLNKERMRHPLDRRRIAKLSGAGTGGSSAIIGATPEGSGIADFTHQPGGGEVRSQGDGGHPFGWLRTRLSLERTMMSWIWTATALIGFGFAIVQFLERMQQMPGTQPAYLPGAPRYLGLSTLGTVPRWSPPVSNSSSRGECR